MSKERFVELVNKLEGHKEEIKKIREELNSIMLDLGEGAYLQDPQTGVVFKIVRPDGTFVEYKKIDYVRTAKPTEKRGSLSKKEAEEAGFILLK